MATIPASIKLSEIAGDYLERWIAGMWLTHPALHRARAYPNMALSTTSLGWIRVWFDVAPPNELWVAPSEWNPSGRDQPQSFHDFCERFHVTLPAPSPAPPQSRPASPAQSPGPT